MRKKKDIFAFHRSTFKTEKLKLFESMSLKEFGKRVSSLNIVQRSFQCKSGPLSIEVSSSKERNVTVYQKLGRDSFRYKRSLAGR